MISKTDMLQDIEKVLVTEEEIRTAVATMGEKLAEEYRGKCPVVVGILKGVVPFYAAMTEAMPIPLQEDFMVVSSYGDGTESSGEVVFRKDLGIDIEGRHVLLLEDIVDTGLTLKKVVEKLWERKPASIKVCTLLDKPSGRKVEFAPDYCCFTIPDGFVVGCGLDYADYYRNLPFVGILKKNVYMD